MNMRKLTQIGFTLIELLITVVIVAILAAIALPSYQAYARRTYRAEAAEILLENAQTLERNFTTANRYDVTSGGAPLSLSLITQSPKTGTAKYDVAPIVLSTTAYTLAASPVAGGVMDTDECGTLQLDQVGNKTVSGASVSAAYCWK